MQTQNKYLAIYNYLKDKISSKEIKQGDKLPSENSLSSEFNVSRNTVRRAIDKLASEGLVTSVHGKGVFVLEKQPFEFKFGGLQSFKEASEMNVFDYITTVPVFDYSMVDESLALKTSFDKGTQILHTLRVRNIEGENVILDVNYFRRDVMEGVTPEIAIGSIYDFLEKENGVKISGAQKMISVEPATELDKQYIEFKDEELVAVIVNYVYLDDGSLFEYTESRHRLDRFVFTTFARRTH